MGNFNPAKRPFGRRPSLFLVLAAFILGWGSGRLTDTTSANQSPLEVGLNDWITDLYLAPDGRIYVTGSTQNPIFPLANAYQPNHSGGDYDGFITVFAPDGQSVVYSTFLGGHGIDIPATITVDDSGRIIVSGDTTSEDFPLANPIQSTRQGGRDSFVTVFASDGQSLIYSTYLGGNSSDYPVDLVVDGSGQVTVVGATYSPDFPLANAVQPTAGGEFDAFITTFAADGQSFIFSTYLGGNLLDSPSAVALDSSGSLYVAGYTESTDFPLVNPFQAANGGGSDAFLSVLAPDGQSLTYSTYLGGQNSEFAAEILLNGSGQLYMNGGTRSPDFPLVNPLQPANAGSTDGFLTIFAPGGQSLVYSTFLGGESQDNSLDIALDSSDRIYLAGETTSWDFPLMNPYQAVGAGIWDATLSILSPDGQALEYSSYLGGTDGEGGQALAVDGSGRAYLAGLTLSQNFPMVNAFQPTYSGGTEGYLTIFASDGQSLDYSTYLHGEAPDPTGVGVSSFNGDERSTAVWLWLLLGLACSSILIRLWKNR